MGTIGGSNWVTGGTGGTDETEWLEELEELDGLRDWESEGLDWLSDWRPDADLLTEVTGGLKIWRPDTDLLSEMTEVTGWLKTWPWLTILKWLGDWRPKSLNWLGDWSDWVTEDLKIWPWLTVLKWLGDWRPEDLTLTYCSEMTWWLKAWRSDPDLLSWSDWVTERLKIFFFIIIIVHRGNCPTSHSTSNRGYCGQQEGVVGNRL